MVSTQDFAHEVWQSLENIRERLAVLEAELRHTRRDLLRLETSLTAHVADHKQRDHRHNAGNDNGNGSGITIKINRKLLGLGGSVLALIAGAGRVLGWW